MEAAQARGKSAPTSRWILLTMPTPGGDPRVSLCVPGEPLTRPMPARAAGAADLRSTLMLRPGW
jgi:hypothetical protein